MRCGGSRGKREQQRAGDAEQTAGGQGRRRTRGRRGARDARNAGSEREPPEGQTVTAEDMAWHLRLNERLRTTGHDAYPIAPMAAPHECVHWEAGKKGCGVWRHAAGAAYAEADDERALSDPLLRVHLRSSAVEIRERGGVYTPEGVLEIRRV